MIIGPRQETAAFRRPRNVGLLLTYDGTRLQSGYATHRQN